LFKDRLKAMLGGAVAPTSGDNSASGIDARKGVNRASNGLEQFFSLLKDRSGLTLLDFAGASQANITFITNMGHRLSSEDFIRSLDQAFGDGDFYANQSDPDRLSRFRQETLNFPENHFDGALVWDSLQFLSPDLLQPTVEQLHRILRPGSSMLAFFHSDEKTDMVQSYYYRISDPKTLNLVPRGTRKRAQIFNNRALERLFGNFANVKFFLTRDNLREVIVRR
jgi:hypothetical protein